MLDSFIVVAEKYKKTNINIVYNIMNAIEKYTGISGYPLIVFGETAAPVIDNYTDRLYASRIYGEVPLLGSRSIVDYGIHEAYEWAQDFDFINNIHVIVIWSADYKSRSLEYYLGLLSNFSEKATIIVLRPSVPSWLATIDLLDYFNVKKVRKTTNPNRLVSDIFKNSNN